MKPIIYLYFHSIIMKWKGREMSEKEFRSCFFQWRIPKSLRFQIMKDMEKSGLIEIKKKTIFLKDFYFEVPQKSTKQREKNNYVPYENLELQNLKLSPSKN